MSYGGCVQEVTDFDYVDFEYDEDYDVVARVPRAAECHFGDYEIVSTCTARQCCCNGCVKLCDGIKCQKGKKKKCEKVSVWECDENERFSG